MNSISNYRIYVIAYFIVCYALPAFPQCSFTVNAGPDILVCPPSGMGMLMGSITGNPTEFYWEPSTGLSNPRILNPKVTITGPQEYTLIAKGISGTNLVINGDFESGNAGFTTDYMIGQNSCYGFGFLDCEGTYGVLTNPQLGHTGFSPCPDHTSGSGNMMVVNGAPAFQNIWCQSIPVVPNMDYILTAWACSVSPASPAVLQFSVNGDPVGNIINVPGSTCVWVMFQATWNSGGNTTADICILNQNTAGGGNDFALDDISFKKICQVEDKVLVDVLKIDAIIEEPPVATCDKPIITLSGVGSSTGPDWKYKWTTVNGKIISGGNTLNPMVEGPGFYTLEVCHVNPDCCQSVTIEVKGNIIPPKVTLTTNDTLGCNKLFGTIYSSSNSPYTLNYNWSGPNGFNSAEKDPLVFEGGMYNITITDEFNCTATASITVLENSDNPKVKIDGQDLNCVKDSATLKANSSIKNSTFQWVGPKGKTQTGDSWTVADTGWYFLKTITPSGCEKRDSFHVNSDFSKPGITISKNDLNCIIDTAFVITNLTGKNASVSWSGPNNFTSDSTHFFTKTPGTYIAIVVQENGCTKIDSVQIKLDNAVANVSVNADSLSCAKSQTNVITLCDDTSAVYQWIGNNFNSTEKEPLIFNAGKYILTVTSKNGCTTTRELNVFIDDVKLVSQLNKDTLTCSKNKLILSYTSSLPVKQIKWLGPNGFTSTLLNPEITEAGTYYVWFTGANGCVSLDSVIIPELKNFPTIEYAPDTLTCSKDKFNLQSKNGGPNQKYNWTGPNNFSSTIENPLINAAGKYSVTITNDLGCTIIQDVNVLEDIQKPSATYKSDTLTCAIDSLQIQLLNSNRVNRIQWTGPNNFSSTSISPYVTQSGIYTANLIGVNGCSDLVQVEIFQDVRKPDLTILFDTINCKKLTATITANSSQNNLTYTWIGPNNFQSNQQSIQVPTGGIYQIKIVNDVSCFTLGQVNIIEDKKIPDILIAPDTLNCKITSLNLDFGTTSAIQSLQWTGPNNFQSNQKNPTIQIGGLYMITLIGNNFCQNTANIIIFQDTVSPILSTTIDTITCSKPEISLLATSNNQNSISWTNPQGIIINSPLLLTTMPGLYKLEAVGGNYCVKTLHVLVPADTITPKATLNDAIINCITYNVDLVVKADLMNVKFNWSGPNNFTSTSDSNNVHAHGVYTVTVTASNGCKTVVSNLVKADTTLPAFNLITDSINCKKSFATVIADRDLSLFDVQWTSPDGNIYSNVDKITTSQGGLVRLWVKNLVNGCNFTNVTIVPEDTNRIRGLDLEINNIICGNVDGKVNVVHILGGHNDLKFSLDNGITFFKNKEIKNLSSGKYNLYVVDEVGCSYTESFEIIDQPYVITDLIPKHTIQLGDSMRLHLNLNLPLTKIKSIKWTPSEGLSCNNCVDPIVKPLGTNFYSVEVIDENGCKSISEVRIIVETPTIYVPNVFSPNGDRLNDIATIFGPDNEVIKINLFRIFDRWGEMVFESKDFFPNDESHGWNGQFRNEHCIPGVYVYVVDAELINGKNIQVKGDITLIR